MRPRVIGTTPIQWWVRRGVELGLGDHVQRMPGCTSLPALLWRRHLPPLFPIQSPPLTPSLLWSLWTKLLRFSRKLARRLFCNFFRSLLYFLHSTCTTFITTTTQQEPLISTALESHWPVLSSNIEFFSIRRLNFRNLPTLFGVQHPNGRIFSLETVIGGIW